MSAAKLTLIGKPGCHLCDDARAVVTTVLADFESVTLDELSILDDAALHEQYVEEIPVLLLNGRVHNIWRVDADRLRRSLEEATA
ncbi:glutaredoxin family protein [Glaciihabitans arcticus]|uniref:Glutaredoxin family protein n=1 Tax=Glaciihabitans arcticus TaxID=2668039 RepID=A0A4Q9GTR3_9MICO|nr:glutaredoxin family protein [Glaciihabitans arcticus]TBN58432.1 glutaredoxin family protein [Glaciihabitans arcticus]